MPKKLTLLAALAVLAVILAPAANAQSAAARAVVDKYCIGCHNQKLKTGGVALQDLDWSNIGGNAPVLEKVLRKLRMGEMPPVGLPRPDAATYASVSKWLEESLDAAAKAHPNPGRPAIHRLNRAEYSNTVRDLLALDIQPGAMLPGDDSGYGFDNIGDVLSTSPALLERYMTVSRVVSQLAVGDPTMPHAEEEFLPRAARAANGSEDLPFNSTGGMAFPHYFPLDAEYVIRIKIGDDTGREMRLPIPAGPHTVAVAYVKTSAKAESTAPGGRRGGGGGGFGGRGAAALLDLRLDGVRIKRFENNGGAQAIDRLLIDGPFKATGRGDTPSRAKIFTCRPAAAKDEEPCARTILTSLAHRAFRRPVTDADVRPLLAFYTSGRKEGDFDHGIEKALRAVLVSPDFLFRIEQDPKSAAPGSAYRISDLELASRLSFFLWSSIPDDELLKLAEAGKLKTPAVLEQQVRRMLDDPRSEALTRNFAGQWLQLRTLVEVRPDPDIFPEFDDSLRQAIRQETELFFKSIVDEDRSILDLLGANYTFLNERLADHYEIPDIYGPQFRRVSLTDPNRGGLLGQSSILTVTSYPNRTSVVQRGKWVLENLLGTPPPPPPPDVPELKPKSKDGKALSLREAMEAHRANAICAGCHARMDPIGFALENYDGVGKWRKEDAGAVINAAGKLPDGSQFEGPAGLKKLLLNGHRDEFIDTVTERLMTYALGRGLEPYDRPAARAIAREIARDNYRMSALILAIVKSTPFQMRRTPEP